MAVSKRSSDNWLPDFPTIRFEGYKGLWVGAETHAELKAEVERKEKRIQELEKLLHQVSEFGTFEALQEAIDIALDKDRSGE